MATTPDGRRDGGRTAGRRERPPGLPAAFELLSDMVVVLGEGAIITYANQYTFDLSGYPTDEVIGRPITAFLHPDDVVRAAEVVGRMTTLGVEAITPADYRLAHSDGSWYTVELNGIPFDPETGGTGSSVLVIGRHSGDRLVQSQVLEGLTENAPIGEILAVIPRFGTWRVDEHHFAVLVPEPQGRWSTSGSPLVARAVAEVGGPDTPWARAAAGEHEVEVAAADLPDALRTMATEAGFDRLWARPVPDPLTGANAVVVAWTHPDAFPAGIAFSLDEMARTLALVLQWRDHVVRLDELTGGHTDGAADR